MIVVLWRDEVRRMLLDGATSDAIAYWVSSMSRDEVKAKDKYHSRELDKELKRYLKHAVSHSKITETTKKKRFGCRSKHA